MKVLFTHSYFLLLDPKQVAHSQPYPPLGTILAAAYLRSNGYDVALFDPMFSPGPEGVNKKLEEYLPDIFVVYDDGFNYLTKMCLSNMREAAFKMQAQAKKHNCKVIVSSSDATDHAEKYLSHGADLVLTGEAEHTLLEVVKRLEKKSNDFSDIPGLALRAGHQLTRTAARPVSRNLDEFPVPAWDLVDIAPYKKIWLQKHGYFSINVATTRGCPYKCNWCAKPIYGNMYNMRSVERVMEEIRYLKLLFNFDHIWFCDDIFGLKRSWVTEFAEATKKLDFKLKYKIQSRADLLIQKKYVESLAASGCHEVWMGAESGSQKVLDAMDKGTTVEEIREARKLLKQNNIRAAFFLQFGYPGETKEDINRTIQLVKETMPEDIGISVSYPLPGTAFYDKVQGDLREKTNWTDSDDLHMMFRNTFRPKFYKILHRLVHSIYRRRKASNIFAHEPGITTKLKAGARYLKHATRSYFLDMQLKLYSSQTNVNQAE
jgi:anaerobic magnesium-protoporphyrin IX monomethyl ester cyclase